MDLRDGGQYAAFTYRYGAIIQRAFMPQRCSDEKQRVYLREFLRKCYESLFAFVKKRLLTK